MAEYLEREALLKSLTQTCKDCENNFGCDCEECDYALAMLYVKSEKAADVQPVKRGKWIKSNDELFLTCSECKEDLLYNTITRVTVWSGNKGLPPFCPCCGADLREIENG